MRVSLRKPYARQVVTVLPGFNATTHDLRGEWHYDRVNRAKCGKYVTGIMQRQSGKAIEITCGNCNRVK